MDFLVNDQGSVVVLTPVSKQAREWAKDNLQVESWQMLGRGIAMDHRPAQAVIDGIQAEGFTMGGA